MLPLYAAQRTNTLQSKFVKLCTVIKLKSFALNELKYAEYTLQRLFLFVFSSVFSPFSSSMQPLYAEVEVWVQLVKKFFFLLVNYLPELR